MGRPADGEGPARGGVTRPRTLRVLVLGDGEGADTAARLLADVAQDLTVERAHSLDGTLGDPPDCIVLETGADGSRRAADDAIARTLQARPDAPIVTVSLRADTAETAAAVHGGAETHLAIDQVDADGLARAIVAAIERSRRQREVESLLAQQSAMNERLRLLAHMKDEFVAIASHELRTPVTVVQGFLELLSTRWDRLGEDERLEMVHHAYRNARRLAEMTDDLITMAHIDGTASRRIERTPFPVREAVLQAVEVAHLVDVEVEVDVPSELTALGDLGLVRRMVRNYLDNAAKHGAPPFHLTAAISSPTRVEVRVRDHGPGVPEDFVPHMFERFTQAEASTTRKGAGTGLGLAIVRGMARTLGGDAWYEPADPGSVFAISLPRADVPTGALDESATDAIVLDPPDGDAPR